jgi:hypothetical protein
MNSWWRKISIFILLCEDGKAAQITVLIRKSLNKLKLRMGLLLDANPGSLVG